jgi:hypothetical protein
LAGEISRFAAGASLRRETLAKAASAAAASRRQLGADLRGGQSRNE